MILDPKGITFGLHDSLITPIGAKSIEAIEKYVGKIDQNISNEKFLPVSFTPLASPNKLEVWNDERSIFLNYPIQLWVDVDYRNYRKTYNTIFEKILENETYVVDHIMNRKLARSLGYKYVRLLHISRASNSSGGRGGETYANKNLPTGLSINPDINTSEIVYADPMDILKMLNIKVGGFGLDAVRDRHYLLYG